MRRAHAIFVLAPIVLALGCSGPAQEEAAPEEVAAVDPRAEALARGRLLYEANCATCHGPGAQGDGPAAASLPVPPANILEHFGDHAFEDMVRMVGEGIPPAMPPAAIGPVEVRLALSYVWSLIPPSDQARIRALQEMAAEEH